MSGLNKGGIESEGLKKNSNNSIGLNPTFKLFRTFTEQLVPETSKLTRKVPKWCCGTYIRTGPGKFDFGKDFKVESIMDGYAIISKFEIEEDTVKYSKKYLESDAYKKAEAAGRTIVCEYGTRSSPDPGKSRFAKYLPSAFLPELSDNGNMNLFRIGDKMCVTGETCYFRELHLGNLEAGEKFDTNKIFGLNVATPHPLTDDDGSIYNVGSSIMRGVKINIVKTPPPEPGATLKGSLKKSRIISSIPGSYRGFMSQCHSFGMSKNYIVVIEQPFVLNLGKMIRSLWSQTYCFRDWLEWKPKFKNRFRVVEKATGKVLPVEICSAIPFFFLHVINCFEINNQIVLDVVTFRDPSVLDDLNLQKLREGDVNSGQGTPQRFVIPIIAELDGGVGGGVIEGAELVNMTGSGFETGGLSAIRDGDRIYLKAESLAEQGLEFPTISSKFARKNAEFFYATGSVARGFFKNALCKVNLNTKETQLLRESNSWYFGEPVFVANPEGIEEDDGIIISTVTDVGDNTKDFLMFVDAKYMIEIARAEFEADVDPAFHGIFLSK